MGGGGSRRPKGRVGEGTVGVSSPVGGNSGSFPPPGKSLQKWSNMVPSGVQIEHFKLTQF